MSEELATLVGDEVETEQTTSEVKTDEVSAEEKPAEEPTKTGEEKVSTPETEWTKEMALDERRKRQKIEKEFEEFKTAKEVKRPDVFDDQEGAFSHVEKNLTQRFQDQVTNLSRSFMMELKPDYEEKEKVFSELANNNPTLINQCFADPNPAKFAYDYADKHLKLKEIENIDDLRSKIREEERQKILQEIQEGKDKDAETVDKLPPSLANARSASEGGDPIDKGLEDIFER